MRLNLVLFLSTFYLLIFIPLKFRFCKVKILLEATFFNQHFYLPEMPVQNSHGVLSSLVLCILDMELAYSVHSLVILIGPVWYLLQVSKNDDEEHCFLK